jgi:hypothetical protein
VVAAVGMGALAWGGRVAASVPRNPGRDKVEPFVLAEPWRGYVIGAQRSKSRFDRVVDQMGAGPLRDRLAGLAERLDEGIDESWQIARRGNEITDALSGLDTSKAQLELHQLDEAIASRGEHHQPTQSETRTRQALMAQIESARRLETIATDARDRLRLLDARFDELVARAIEVSVGSGDSSLLGNDVDELVTELESLRLALDETNKAEESVVPAERPPVEQPQSLPPP